MIQRLQQQRRDGIIRLQEERRLQLPGEADDFVQRYCIVILPAALELRLQRQPQIADAAETVRLLRRRTLVRLRRNVGLLHHDDVRVHVRPRDQQPAQPFGLLGQLLPRDRDAGHREGNGNMQQLVTGGLNLA
ncbi:hypothetical protein GXP70_25835 [Paenibacillus lycopersici]|uniref:Uncharacterized protein n=1 Tax=Paenibacillus lycopersici TaxID=2704462 RepID=A0A6C0G0T0_9BACL|nr:hypothetical protein [Paenibacillus lycopersici]QHT63048.1 hypothetical protein GXP70_25835 [Paenibacillus lycopersici]